MAIPLRVLLIEDTEDDALLILRALRQGRYEVSWTRVFAPQPLRAALAGQAWDLVISDYSMPGFTAMEALALVREHDLDLPFIMISGTVGEETAVGAMKAGAGDYLMKGNLTRLVPAVRRELTEAAARRERHRMEAELEESRQQFIQAQKMEAVGQLAAGVAHDFNNMLAVINGYTEMVIARLAPGDPNQRCLSEVLKAGERAGRLTRQLLAFSRKQVLQPQVLDLGEAVTGIASMLRRLIGEDIQLESQAGAEPALARVDPGQLEQVLMNLAVNARDAMPRGGRLIVRTEPVDLTAPPPAGTGLPAGSYVLLEVQDTGCGMDAETRRRIFEPFFTTKQAGHGTGLGLATVYGIVEQSGGHIEVESEVEKGTCFRIYLPRLQQASAAEEDAECRPSELAGAETVLLVEDEEIVRELVQELLRHSGYTVLAASSAEDAARIWRAHPGGIDLLLTDVVLPGLSGRELANRLREARPGTKVLMMSGYTDDAMLRHGVLTSEIPFIQKPFSSSALARKLREVLEDRVFQAG